MLESYNKLLSAGAFALALTVPGAGHADPAKTWLWPVAP